MVACNPNKAPPGFMGASAAEVLVGRGGLVRCSACINKTFLRMLFKGKGDVRPASEAVRVPGATLFGIGE